MAGSLRAKALVLVPSRAKTAAREAAPRPEKTSRANRTVPAATMRATSVCIVTTTAPRPAAHGDAALPALTGMGATSSTTPLRRHRLRRCLRRLRWSSLTSSRALSPALSASRAVPSPGRTCLTQSWTRVSTCSALSSWRRGLPLVEIIDYRYLRPQPESDWHGDKGVPAWQPGARAERRHLGFEADALQGQPSLCGPERWHAVRLPRPRRHAGLHAVLRVVHVLPREPSRR